MHIKCLNACPFNAGHINGESMAAPSKSGVGFEPFRQWCAKIPQRKRTARMRGKISDGKPSECAGSNNSAKGGKIFGQCAEHTKPILTIVDFQTLECGKAAVGRDERLRNHLH